MTDRSKRLLFVCVENACRSQMAEAFARMQTNDAVQAFSAGSRPSGQVNPRAIQFMAELAYDLGQHYSKSLEEVPPGEYAAVITMGCGDECEMIPARLREDWPLPDPKNLPDEGFRQVRDEIRQRVRGLLRRI